MKMDGSKERERVGTNSKNVLTEQLDKRSPNVDSEEVQQSLKFKEQSHSKEEEFLVELILESQHFLSLQNNSGKNEPPESLRQDIQPLIDEQDQFTPDNWIPRSSQLTRLSGTHPFNAEPGLSTLFDAGMITPTQLHYVRNHGAVPKLDWNTHKLEIADPEGLLQYPTALSMDDIAKMEWISIPVTLACDGNRRGEVNRIRQSGGFDWGPCIYKCSVTFADCSWDQLCLLERRSGSGYLTKLWHQKTTFRRDVVLTL